MDIRRYSILVAACLFSVALFAGPKDFVQKSTRPSMVKSLAGEWNFKCFQGADWSECSGFYEPGYDFSAWQKIRVPGCWDALGYAEPMYRDPKPAVGLYSSEFEVPAEWSGKRIFLETEGVMFGYTLWINGREAGSWSLAHNACQFDVTDFLQEGGNKISFCVTSQPRGFEFDSHDDWSQMGIYAGVSLFAVSDLHCKDLVVKTYVPEGEKPYATFDFALGSFSSDSCPARLRGKICNASGFVVHRFSIKGEAGSVCSYRWTPKRARLWTAETPELYTLKYRVGKNRYSERFGIREVRVDGVRLLVNNTPVKLRGTCYHDCDLFDGKAVSDSSRFVDFSLMKQASINFIRLSHYPRTRRFYDLCDSVGIYVMDEIPFGHGDYHLYDTRYGPDLLLRSEATVLADRNHPSIIIWSVGNENNFTPITEAAGRYAKELDDTRPICYPMMGNYFDRVGYDIPEFVDIYAPHYPGVQQLEDYAGRNDRPMILTEYCHSFGVCLEDHDKLWNLIQTNESLAGGAVWHWADQGMVLRNEPYPGKYGRTDKVWISESQPVALGKLNGADGLVYPTRDPLPDYYVVRHNYALVSFLSEEAEAVPDGFEVEIKNYYDFSNLKDKVQIRWALDDCATPGRTVSSGILEPDCPPQGTCMLHIKADMGGRIADGLMYLKLDVIDKETGLCINERSYLLNSEEEYRAVLERIACQPEGNVGDYIARFPIWRTGRKPTIAEEQILSGTYGLPYVQKYLMLPARRDGAAYEFANDEIRYEGTIDVQSSGDGSLSAAFDLATQTKGLFITAAGLSVMLKPEIRYFQWIGQGPYSQWPGKDVAGMRGVHSLEAGDLYFEGDKLGVDLLLCTDAEGNGLIIRSDCSTFNLEETDEGVIVSVDPVLSGCGPKYGVTSYSNFSDSMGSVKGTMQMIPVKGGQWSDAMGVFKDPKTIKKYAPFVKAYDIYLNRFSDACCGKFELQHHVEIK